jgi:hypothetical protein
MAPPSADDIINGINSITNQLKNLQTPANQITILSAPLLLIGQGPFPQIIAGLSSVISTVTGQTIFLQSITDNYDNRADDLLNAVKTVSS